jgi:hypothetical protein
VTIRILGVAQGDVSAAHLVLGTVSARLDATGDALQLDGVPAGTTLDVSTDMQAFPLGALRLADLSGPVAVTVSFAGGDGARPTASGALATCTAPITFRFAPGQVNATRCQAIVKLDVGRSLLAMGGALTLLPQFEVAF